MISKKGLVALIVIVALIGAGIYFAISYNPPKEVDENPAKEYNTVVVYENDVNLLKEINVKLYDEEFTFVSKNESFILKGKENAVLKSSYVNELASAISVLVAKDIVEENATDLEKYGFSNPKAEIKAVFENEEKIIKIGGQTFESAYFMNIEGDRKVYMIYSTKGDLLTKPLAYYRDFNLLKVTGTNLIKAQVKNGKDVMTFEKKNGRWYVTNPIFKDVNEDILNEKIFANISYFMAKEFVDETDKNYEKYSLANPEKSVYIEDDYGIKQTFFFGDVKDDICYARLEGKDGVFTMDKATMAVFDVKMVEMVDSYVNLPNIKTVKKITVTSGGKTYSLERNEKVGNVVYKINGNNSNEEKYREFYMAVISVAMSDFCTEPYKNNMYAKIVFEYNDSTVRTFEYMDYSSRQLVVYENKKSIGYVSKSHIENIINMFN